MTTITRSRGIMVAGYNPGGGHSALDPDLDRLVAEAAERLRQAYDEDVEIRFNSDRQSGGAFLKRAVSVGFSIGQVDLERLRSMDDGGDFAETCTRMGLDPSGPNTQTTIRLFVDASELKDPTVANCQGRTPYAYLHAIDLDDAMTILERMHAR